jgi:hypothetical protein
VTLNKAAKRVGLGMKMMAGLGGVGLLPKVDALAGEPAMAAVRKADNGTDSSFALEEIDAA